MPERRQPPSAAMGQLAQLADAEAAQMKERHRARDAAIRRYEAARDELAEAEKTMTAARKEQAEAISTLVESGLDTNTVGALLGIDARRVREARATKREAPTKGRTEGASGVPTT